MGDRRALVGCEGHYHRGSAKARGNRLDAREKTYGVAIAKTWPSRCTLTNWNRTARSACGMFSLVRHFPYARNSAISTERVARRLARRSIRKAFSRKWKR